MGEVRASSDSLLLLLLLAASVSITLLVFPSVNLTFQISPSRAVEKSRDVLILAPVVLVITYGFLGIYHVCEDRWLSSYGSSDTQKSSLSNPKPLFKCHDSDHGIDNSPAALQVPQPLPPPSFPPLEEKRKKTRGGLGTEESSGAKTKKKNRGQEKIKISKSPPVAQPQDGGRRRHRDAVQGSGSKTVHSKSGSKSKKKNRGQERVKISKSTPVSQPQEEGRRRHRDAVQGSGSKTVHSKKTRKVDCNKEEQQFQSKQVSTDDYCHRKAAVPEQAATKERKAKGTRQTIAQKPALQVPQPDSFHPSKESKKNRGGLAIKECSSSLKTKKIRGRGKIENSKSPPVSQSVPSSSHQPLPAIDTPFAHKKGKTMADLAALLPPAPHKKKSHTPMTVTPNSEPSDDNPNSSGSSPSTSLQPPPSPPRKGLWLIGMSGGSVLVNCPLGQTSPDAEDYEDSIRERIENASGVSSEATSPAVHLCQDVEFANFISRVKAKRKLEEMNSRKRRRSNVKG
ncbi:hypothetical protein EUGRSUZ_C01191 [Eucalyptus grandis]|uniref:Uncharacterized protein n=2 Tax=Eucalyptus grandis TaxID=71139 RepID=A0A059CN25_EUCGR|nr:hypothetical protein EUGRSUZ_C01191 [Eucalyptus grandis]